MQVRELIGVRAERLAWIFCMVDRASVDVTLAAAAADAAAGRAVAAPPAGFRARPELGGFAIALADATEYIDFVEVPAGSGVALPCLK